MPRIDTILAPLVSAIALVGVLPLLPHVGWHAQLIVGVAWCSGLLLDRRKYGLSSRVATVITVVIFLLQSAQIGRGNLVVPAAQLVTLLLAVRLVTIKSPRHYLQIFALSLFSLAGSTLFSLAAGFFFYLVLLLVLMAVALVLLTVLAECGDVILARRDLQPVVGRALVLPALTLPLALFFFLILPRTQFPLWRFLDASASQSTGLSEKVVPGASRDQSTLSRVAFRARMKELPREQLYWRAIVLNSPAENGWVRKPSPAEKPRDIPVAALIPQLIYPEPGKDNFLVSLDVPRRLSLPRSIRHDDFTFVGSPRRGVRQSYEAYSDAAGTIKVNRIDRDFYLQLPSEVDQEIRNLVRKLAAGTRNDGERLARIEKFFTANRFTYATSNLPIGREPLSDFLFKAHRGNCEYFASSSVLLLRLAGVPTRLVGGYLGGDYNQLGGYYVVTDARAHVWVEVHFDGQGWVRIDPSVWAVNGSDLGRSQQGFFARAGLYLDALSYLWNVAIINYDLERQVTLASGLARGTRGLPVASPAAWLTVLAGVVAVMAVCYLFRCQSISREERFLRELLRHVRKRYGIDPATVRGMYQLAGQVGDRDLVELIHRYGEAIYQDRPLSSQELRQMLRFLHRK